MPDIKGVDVSSAQGEPGAWTKLPAARDAQWAGVKFTELEANGNHFVNPDAKDDWDWLWYQEHHEGRPLGRIAYLFAHPSRSVSDTLALFKSQTDKLGLLDTDGVCIDLEVTDGMSPAAVSSWARELAAEMAKLYGRRPIIYTYEDFIHQGNCEGLGNYFLWIASIRTPGLPNIPGVWQDWFAQQYAQDGHIDQDVAHFSTLAAMRAAMGRPSFKTTEAVWVTAGMDGLVDLSHLIQTEIPVILERTLAASANHRFAPDLHEYLTVGDLSAVMPRGISLRYLKTERA
jgi:GH25 family lysozyme M1 (1,4-beta-N-acetylmuramidase)